MVEELKLAIKVDDDAIEQSLLKQFANAEKMANKVVLTFNNIDLDDKAIEAKFKEMQKMAGKNPIDLSIDKSSIEMLSAISKQLGNIFDIAKGKSIIDSSATTQIDKLQSKLDELTKKYNELSSKKIGGNVSGKDVSLVDNEEFKKLSQDVQNTKDEITALKENVKSLFQDMISDERVVDRMDQDFQQMSLTVDNLTDKIRALQEELSNVSSGNKSNISSENLAGELKEKINESEQNFKEVNEVVSSFIDTVRKISSQTKNLFESGNVSQFKESSAFFNPYQDTMLSDIIVGDFANTDAELTKASREHLKSIYEDIIGYLHSHPAKTASFSDKDLINQIYNFINDGIYKQIVIASDEIMELDYSQSNPTEISELAKRFSTIRQQMVEMIFHQLTSDEIINNINSESNFNENFNQRFENSAKKLMHYVESNFDEQISSFYDFYIDAIKGEDNNFDISNAFKDSLINSQSEEEFIAQIHLRLSSLYDAVLEDYTVSPDSSDRVKSEISSYKDSAIQRYILPDIISVYEDFRNNTSESAEKLQEKADLFDQKAILKTLESFPNKIKVFVGSVDDFIEKAQKTLEISPDESSLISKQVKIAGKYGDVSTYGNSSSDAIEEFVRTTVEDTNNQINKCFKNFTRGLISESDYDSAREDILEELNQKMIGSGIEEISSFTRNNDFEIWASTDIDELIKKIREHISDGLNEWTTLQQELNAYANSVKPTSSLLETSSTSPIKDVFQGDDKVNTDASTTAIKEESQALEQVSTSAKDAATSKEKFANANKEVKASAESSSTSLGEERKKFDDIGDSAEKTKKKLDDVIFKPNTEGFDEIVSKLDIAKDKIEEISKITKSSVWSESQGEYLESYNIKYKNGTSEIRGESSNKKGSNVLRANEVAYDAKAAEQEAKAVKEVWDKNVKAIQDYMDAVTKLNNLNAKDKGSGKYASQIALQEKNVEELKEKALEARTAITSMINPHDVPLNTWRDYLDVMKKFDQASLGSAESVAKLEDALRKMDFSSLESASTKFKSQFDNLSIKPDGDHQFLSWTNDLKELNAKIDEYNSKVKYLKENNIVDGKQVDEVKRLRDEIEETINAMTKTPQAKRGWTDIGASKATEKVANVLKQNTKMSKEAKDAIRAYYNELRSGNPSQPIDEILVKVNQLVQKERELGRVGKSFGEIFKEKVIYGGAAQLAGMFGFYDVINVIRQAGEAVIDLNTNITELAKVSEASVSQIYDDFNSYADIAKEVGGTISDTISATADWSRNGYNIPDAKELAEVAMIYKNVGDGIDIDQANEYLISTLRGFSLEAKDAMDIIDSINEVANNEPISSAGIGEALQRSAAAFNVANTSLQESIALVTSTNSVLQSPEKVGSMWTTVSARIRGAKTELEDAGLETDGMVESTSKLQAMIKGMTGFDILEDDQKTFKSIYDIIIGIGEEFQNLSGVDQAALLEALAGKRQSNALAATLNNIDLLKKAYGEATNAEGSAMAEQEKYQQSIQYSIDRTKASLEELANDFISSDFLKGLIDSGDKLINLLDLLIDKFGVLGTAAGIGGIVAGFKNVGRLKMQSLIVLNCRQ